MLKGSLQATGILGIERESGDRTGSSDENIEMPSLYQKGDE